MIISASRRTDIPAFYAEWFINRIQAGYCLVPNPFNRAQVARVSLLPEEVEVIVFWTRNPRPLIPILHDLDQRSYRYYFQYTLLDNPRPIDPYAPSIQESITSFRSLADQIGPQKVIWRYDPIVFTTITQANFHHQRFETIANALKGYTHRAVISLVDAYPKAIHRLQRLAEQGIEFQIIQPPPPEWLGDLMQDLAQIAASCGMEIFSCAEELPLAQWGIQPGKCVDDQYIFKTFGIEVKQKKDASQRKFCGCVVSRDIGMYNTCLYACTYCYATQSLAAARQNYQAHNPLSPSLVETK
jgi:hypothetical protein